MQHSNETDPRVGFTIAISATFTAEPLEDVVLFWARKLELPLLVAFGPYNQVFPQLLDPGGVFGRNRSGLNVVLVRWEDLGNEGSRLRAADDLIAALSTAVKLTTVPYLFVLCPASVAAVDTQRKELEELDLRLRTAASKLPNLHVFSPADVTVPYDVHAYDDEVGNQLGHVPYTPAFFAALGTAIVRHFVSLRRPPYKVIALDCDETLWKGVCGEVGPAGIEIDTPRKQLQEFVVARQQEGMLLCLCSKNNEEDVRSVFSQRADMLLRLEHVVAARINWAPKSANLHSLAAELGLGLDSFIFIDDDPVACAEVQSGCPEVLALQLPDSEQILSFLEHVWAFDRVQPPPDDRDRTAQYREHLARDRARSSMTLDDFFASLSLNIRVQPLDRAHLARVAELSQRTNQFNLTTIRRTEADLVRLLEVGELEGLIVDVSDRFGSYGQVGTVLYRVEAGTLVVDSFLLSCRALGRGVEHRMVRELAEVARARGCDRIALAFRPTARNRPAHDFLRSLDAATHEQHDQEITFSLTVGDALAVTFNPASREPSPDSHDHGDRPPDVEPRRRRAPSASMREIASELFSANRIRRAVDLARRRPRPALASAYTAPVTKVEATIADLWSEVLGVYPVGVDDPFFALGGHSLLAAVLVSRMQDLLSEPVSLDRFFARPTIAGVVEMIEQSRIANAPTADIAATLRLLEELSDAEVESLLNSEPLALDSRLPETRSAAS